MGKTNMLDALYYLSFTKHPIHLSDNQLIMHQKVFAILHAFYQDQDRTEEVYCGIRNKQKKIFKRNKKEYDRISEHIGLIPMVLISPMDTDMIIRSGSSERRKFVDMLLSQYDAEYLQSLICYNRALQQRNVLLRNKNVSNEEFELWEVQMARFGEIIHQKRKIFAVDFLPLFKQYYKTIGNNYEIVDFEYLSPLENHSLAELLPAHREQDKIVGFSTTGIHKDDFNFLLNGYLIRKVGSQGQNKTYSIALRLAQYSFLAQKGSSFPILLLDDLFDKLDEERVEKIIRMTTQSSFGQIFITDTHRKHLDDLLQSMQPSYKLFQVENGVIEEIFD